MSQRLQAWLRSTTVIKIDRPAGITRMWRKFRWVFSRWRPDETGKEATLRLAVVVDVNAPGKAGTSNWSSAISLTAD